MQIMMPGISYDFAKLIKRITLGFNMNLHLMKKIGWSIIFGHLLIVLIGTKNMEMWFFLIF